METVPAAGVEFTVGVQLFRLMRVASDHVTRDIGGEFGTLFRVPLLVWGSPSGCLAARLFSDDDGTVRGTVALLSPDTGTIHPIADIPATPHPSIPDVPLRVASSPGGTGIGFVDTRDSIPNIWMKPMRGGQAKRLTNFTSEAILDFA